MSLFGDRVRCDGCGRWRARGAECGCSTSVPTDVHELQGWLAALDGQTACPHGTVREAKLWATGHDKAYDGGLAKLTRFGRRERRRVGSE